jgi:hypothetical protein
MWLSCFYLIIHPIFNFIETHIWLGLQLSLWITLNYFYIIIPFLLIWIFFIAFLWNLKNVISVWINLFLLSFIKEILWKISCLHIVLLISIRLQNFNLAKLGLQKMFLKLFIFFKSQSIPSIIFIVINLSITMMNDLESIIWNLLRICFIWFSFWLYLLRRNCID